MEITESEIDEYESLPPTSSMTTHMAAGAMAGIMEHCFMYPFDLVKTRMMCLRPNPNANYRNLYDACTTIVRYEGIRTTCRGVTAVIGGAGPAHAMYFACYEKLKWKLSGTPQGNPLANGAAGCAATLLHDAVMNPADVVKQRMQIFDSPYKSCTECARTILRTEGLKAFYRSYTTQLSMNIPFQSLHFITYELMQDAMNKNREYNPKTHLVSGGIAGAVAAAVTTPLDVVKTLLNTQEKCAVECMNKREVSGLRAGFVAVYKCCGPWGYFKGLQARVLYQIPSTAVSWTVYEFFKYVITKQRGDTNDGYTIVSSAAAQETSIPDVKP